MKKEILNLVESNEGEFVLNNISYLRRWTNSAIDENVDKLVVEFKNINNVNFGVARKLLREIITALSMKSRLQRKSICRKYRIVFVVI
jgi:hypothetical protein